MEDCCRTPKPNSDPTIGRCPKCMHFLTRILRDKNEKPIPAGEQLYCTWPDCENDGSPFAESEQVFTEEDLKTTNG